MPDDPDLGDDAAWTPNCPACLHPMEPAGTLQKPYWACPHCDATALAR